MTFLQGWKTWLGDKPAARYLVAAVLVLLSLGLRLALLPQIHGMPFLTFLPAILLTIWFCGRWPSILALALAAVLGTRFLFAGPNHLVFPWSSGTVGLAVFCVYGLVMILTLDGMMRANAGMKLAVAARDDMLHTLEHRVEERTAQLSELNDSLREEMQRRQHAEARAAQYARLDALGQLVGGVSHDFNNLLSIITGNLNLAERRLARGDTKIGPHIDAAMEGARKGAELTSRLLTFARRQPVEPVVADINGLVRNMVDMLGTTLGEHILIDLDLAEGLWQTMVEPSQLENAILNLAVNARDAMPAGGQLTLTTLNADLSGHSTEEGLQPGDYVTIVVGDNGTGMPEEVQARAFEPFFTTKAPGHGTGLGLSQIHQLVRQLGGHIALSSKPGAGTSVRLYLPRHQGPAAPAPAPPARSRSKTVTAPRRLVLVVEDDAGVRAVTVEMLADLDCRVLEATCGAEALVLLRDNPEVALLLTDVVMPEMLGHELVEKALESRPDLKVLYTSGYAQDTAVKAGQLPAGARWLAKPFTPEQLADAVGTILATVPRSEKADPVKG